MLGSSSCSSGDMRSGWGVEGFHRVVCRLDCNFISNPKF